MAKSESKKKRSWLLPVAAAVVLLAALFVLLRPSGTEDAVSERQSLTIPKAEITEVASFYPVTIDGTEMEVLAIRTDTGEIRTAMNTCQSCYDSGRGYYEADGTELVCQNCGFRFTADEVGLEGSGGCNPWPITEAQRTDTEDSVQIPYETLLAAKSAFSNWKG